MKRPQKKRSSRSQNSDARIARTSDARTPRARKSADRAVRLKSDAPLADTSKSETADERLQRFLARCGIASRRQAESLIAEGRVTVNGVVVTQLGTKINASRDRISVNGKRARLESPRLYLFHKPPGVLSTMKDPHGRKTIADFTRSLPVRVYPVGRLDSDVSGLLLLTNDGELANQLLHPRYGNGRSYLALVEGEPDAELPKILKKGLLLEDGHAHALAAEVVSNQAEARARFAREDGGAIIALEVGEGRNHLVKRLLEAAGHPVKRLIRVAFGPYRLGDLERGKIREIARNPERRRSSASSDEATTASGNRRGGKPKKSAGRGSAGRGGMPSRDSARERPKKSARRPR